jgi:hypothetical protein
MYPYNYIYYNEIVARKNVNFNWEKDYFGASIVEFDKFIKKSPNKIYKYPENIEYGINEISGSKYSYLPNLSEYQILIWEDINLEGKPYNCVKQKIVDRKLYGQTLELSFLAKCPASRESLTHIVRNYPFSKVANPTNRNKFEVKSINRVSKILGDSLCASYEMINNNESSILDSSKFMLINNKKEMVGNRHSFVVDEKSIRGYQLSKNTNSGEMNKGIVCFDGEKIDWKSQLNVISYNDIQLAVFNLKME